MFSSVRVIKAQIYQKDKIEDGLCSSTYEAVPESSSKFRSRRQFQQSLCQCVSSLNSVFTLSYRMIRWALLAPILLLLGLFIHTAVSQDVEDPAAAVPPGQAPDGMQEEADEDWGLNSLRNGFESVGGYFDSVLEFMGGRDGVCQYRCRYGKAPLPRPGFKMPEPDGCSSYFFGLPVPEGMDMGIPAMTKCCNQLDMCYDTCGSNKYRCDSKFRWCLHSICSDLKKSLGFVSKVEACETVADTLFNTVWTLGCRPYMNSQRAACFCQGEEKDEL